MVMPQTYFRTFQQAKRYNDCFVSSGRSLRYTRRSVRRVWSRTGWGCFAYFISLLRIALILTYYVLRDIGAIMPRFAELKAYRKFRASHFVIVPPASCDRVCRCLPPRSPRTALRRAQLMALFEKMLAFCSMMTMETLLSGLLDSNSTKHKVPHGPDISGICFRSVPRTDCETSAKCRPERTGLFVSVCSLVVDDSDR